ncbi:MAG: hypothetical protein HQL05_01180 [Nitrospirae bacterium]|uniref:hypothetical protein n=1 Tax=Candidatus Magnetobacterium casense TaxID=1455061 RepID=UPI00058FD5FD|nr:hypothetical protein [Candidatus Magnetobacterium casensis]MBF0336421.1 hypothetical protein [Nitrospirota bacterium]
MKTTEELTRDIITSTLVPLLKDFDGTQGIEAYINSIKPETLEELTLYKFIEFVKENIIAIRIAFRCDRGVAWELLGRFFAEMDAVTELGKRCKKKLEALGESLKCRNSSEHDKDLDDRIEEILDIARQFKVDIETIYLERKKE